MSVFQRSRGRGSSRDSSEPSWTTVYHLYGNKNVNSRVIRKHHGSTPHNICRTSVATPNSTTLNVPRLFTNCIPQELTCFVRPTYILDPSTTTARLSELPHLDELRHSKKISRHACMFAYNRILNPGWKRTLGNPSKPPPLRSQFKLPSRYAGLGG
jgi:hypothetical protein